MERATIPMILGVLMALAPGLLWADPPVEPQHLEHLVIENTDTAKEHEALSRYYGTKAADARSIAAEHRSMAQRYLANPARTRHMAKHCERIAELNEQIAAEYENLVKGEQSAAKDR